MKIENIDPRVKFTWFLTAIIAGFMVQTIWAEMLIIAVLFGLEWYFTKSLKNFGVLTLVLLVIGTQLIVIQLLFCREGVLMWQWGIIKIYSDAVPNAIMGYLRTSALAYAGIQFITWTSAQDATLMLHSFGIPYRYAMLVGVAARFFPVMQKEYVAISESQLVRGLPVQGIVNRIKALPPTFFPLLYRAMRRGSDTALSMELRGFGRSSHRTFTKELVVKNWEKVLILTMILIMILLILNNII
ncbi:MAG: energy-coupling factor transporter transmembrane component T [Clostridiales bacterium]